MLCAVYKSPKKVETYIYVLKRDDFSAVPDALMTTFGTPQLVTLLNLSKRDKLALTDINKLTAALSEKGYYLQIPPPQENLLTTHYEEISNKSNNSN